jgi:hypothetical protein
MWECIVVESYMENALYARAAILYIHTYIRATYEYVWRRACWMHATCTLPIANANNLCTYREQR